MMSLVGLYALLKTPLRAITTGRVLTLMTATIITNYNMKLLDIFKRKKNAELECLRDAYNIKRFAFHNIHTAGTAEIKACGDMSKDACAAHEAHESLAHG